MTMLGKHAPKVDPRTLRLGAYLQKGLPPAPKATDYSTLVGRWPMYQNDVHADCTCAAAGHMVELWSAMAGRVVVPSDADVLNLYGSVNGGRDEGAFALDVLRQWRTAGLSGEAPQAFIGLDITDHEHVKLAVTLFGGAYIGLSLPSSAQAQVGSTWDTGTAPGSWGGHAVNVVAYDADGLTCVTWGALQKMTWAFWDGYCDEAYAVLPRSWSSVPGGSKPSGMDFAALQADLAVIGSGGVL